MIKKYQEFLNENYTIAKLKFDDDFNLAINFALKKHHHQIRKFDQTPYIYHPARVAKIILDKTNNKTLAIASFLHDTLEDTDTTFVELEDLFGEKIAKTVQSLTNSEKDINKYGKLQAQIKHLLKVSSEVLTIKLADRLDNVSDFQLAKDSFIKKYGYQTDTLLKYLETHRKLSNEQNNIVQEIRKVLNKYKKIWNPQTN